MEWSQHSEDMERLRKDGIEVDDARMDSPQLFDYLEPLWDFWRKISGSRQLGFGASPLSITDISFAMEIEGLLNDPSTRSEDFDLVLALDQKWVALQHKKSSSKTNSKVKS